MTETIVDDLEPVQVDKQNCEKTGTRILAFLDSAFQLIGKVASVRQVREGIGGLAFGDIRLRTRDSDGSAAGITDCYPPAQHPDIASVLIADSVLARELRRHTLAVRGKLAAHTGFIRRMNTAKPFLGIGPAFVVRIAQHAGPAR